MKNTFSKSLYVLVVLCLISLCSCKSESAADHCKCGNPAGVCEVQYLSEVPTYKTLEEYLLEADGIVYATYTGKYEEVYIHREFKENRLKKTDACYHYGGEEYLIMENIEDGSAFKVRIISGDSFVNNKQGELIDNLIFSQSTNRWEKGKTYIFLVQNLDTGENDGVHRYTMISDAVIPADGGEATLYSEPIENHSTGYNGEGSVEEYIKEFIKNNAK